MPSVEERLARLEERVTGLIDRVDEHFEQLERDTRILTKKVEKLDGITNRWKGALLGIGAIGGAIGAKAVDKFFGTGGGP